MSAHFRLQILFCKALKDSRFSSVKFTVVSNKIEAIENINSFIKIVISSWGNNSQDQLHYENHNKVSSATD